MGEGCKRVEEGIESPSSPGAKEAKEAHAGGTAFGAACAATDLARNNQRAHTAFGLAIQLGYL